MTDGSDKRRYPRHSINLPIQVAKNESDFILTRASDVSLGGLCFHWDEALETGKSVQISIPIESRTHSIESEIVYSVEDRAAKNYRIGIQFQEKEAQSFREDFTREMESILALQKELSALEGHEISCQEAARQWYENKQNA